MASEDSGGRKPRIDVQRNRASILEAATRRFAEHGIGTSLEAIAKEAGVGPGTLYRHFPTREALLAAVLQIRAEELLARRTEIERITDADEALRQWMRALEDYLSAFSGLPEPLLAAIRVKESPLTVPCHTLIGITGDLLRTAQLNGNARTSVQGDDLFLAALSVAWVKGSGAGDETSLSSLRAITETGYTHGLGTVPASRT
ncbi:TetR/AcrR family transcriptional regulator [Streptomyces sp. NPDC056930]|uniref:TetR/AcrR family transcriptional regulator n=1 Tax=Streptomyces sp. NPDC056930 TaxID=3345967 RepID=UPI0036336535